MKTFYETMKEFNLPIEYGRITNSKTKPPFLIYMESGRDFFFYDNSQNVKKRNFRLELYFTQKNDELEERLEKFLKDNGFIFTVSEDIYIDSENIFVIYYEVEQKWETV